MTIPSFRKAYGRRFYTPEKVSRFTSRRLWDEFELIQAELAESVCPDRRERLTALKLLGRELQSRIDGHINAVIEAA